MTAEDWRIARHKVASRIRLLSRRKALTLGDTVRELMLARRPPDALLADRDAELAQQRRGVQLRIDALQAQLQSLKAEMRAVTARQADNDAMRRRHPDDPYVQWLWAELRHQFAGEARGVVSAIRHWQQIETQLSEIAQAP